MTKIKEGSKIPPSEPLQMALQPLSLLDSGTHQLRFNGPPGQKVSNDGVVHDVGSVLDFSILQHILNQSVSVPGSILLHFQAGFSVPRLMLEHDTWSATRAALLAAATASLANQPPSEDHLIALGNYAQQLGIEITPEDLLKMFEKGITENVSKRAAIPILKYLLSQNDPVASFDSLKSIEPMEISALQGSLDLLSSVFTDLENLLEPSNILTELVSRIQTDGFLKSILTLVKIRKGYQLTMVPTTMAHVIDQMSIDVPKIKRWEGMDIVTDTLENEDELDISVQQAPGSIPGQFKFYFAESVFAGKLSLIDLAETIYWMDEQVIGLTSIDLDLTSLIETTVRTNSGRGFLVKPRLGELQGKNLFKRNGDGTADSDLTKSVESLVSIMVLSHVFNPTTNSQTISRIRNLIGRYGSKIETQAYLKDIDSAAEALACVYSGFMATRNLFVKLLNDHSRLSKRYEHIDVDMTNSVIDSGALRRYLEVREKGFQPYFDAPVSLDSAVALSSPAEISLISPSIEIVYPGDFVVSQQRWFNIVKGEGEKKKIVVPNIPPPRFSNGIPVILSTNDMNQHPLKTLKMLLGKTLEHHAVPYFVSPYSSLQVQFDVSAFIRLFPVNRYLDVIASGSSDEIMTISDFINSMPLRPVDMSVSLMQNAFLLRSQALALSMSGEGQSWRDIVNVFHRHAHGEENSSIEISPTVIGSYEGIAYDLGPDPVIFLKNSRVFVENTSNGTSPADWFSLLAPVFVSNEFLNAAAYPYEIGDIVSERPKLAKFDDKPKVDPAPFKLPVDKQDPDPSKVDDDTEDDTDDEQKKKDDETEPKA